MRAARATHGRQQGFVLVLTIWILAAIAIAAAFFGERVQQTLRLATQRQDLNVALIAVADARNEMLFRLAVTPMSMYGLGRPPEVMRLDDRPYSESGTLLQLQDTGGLLNLNAFGDEPMQRLLRTLKVPEDRHARLIDSLRDYADEDNLTRIDGAESAQYRATRPDLPRNAPLLSPLELRQVVGWSEMPWRPGEASIFEFTTTEGAPTINPNTAPWHVLVGLPSVSPEAAKAIIERREVEPVTAAWLDRMLGTQMEGMFSIVSSLPAHSVRVTQAAKGLPWRLRYNVLITPLAAETPWKIMYLYRLENEPASSPALKSGTLPNASDPPRLPPRPSSPVTSPILLPN